MQAVGFGVRLCELGIGLRLLQMLACHLEEADKVVMLALLSGIRPQRTSSEDRVASLLCLPRSSPGCILPVYIPNVLPASGVFVASGQAQTRRCGVALDVADLARNKIWAMSKSIKGRVGTIDESNEYIQHSKADQSGDVQ